MTDFVKYLVENDPLKTAVDLIDSANFGRKQKDKPAAVSISLLFWTTTFLALTKTLYGDGGFTFIQHFWTSLFIVFILYIAVGVVFLLAFSKLEYTYINNKIRCFLTCFLASLTISLFLVFIADFITRWSVAIVSIFPIPGWYVGRIADLVPALVFSSIGCFSIFWMKREKHENHTKQTRAIRFQYWLTFPAYVAVTTFVFYLLAFDRGWFFDNVMKYSFKIIPG